MPAVSRNGDKTNLHDSFTPGSVIATATDFTVAGQPIARAGDKITPHPHTSGSPSHIDATITQGAASFSVGGKAVARIGDPTSCNGKLVEGEAGFFIG